MQNQIHPASDRGSAFTPPNAFTGQVNRRQRGGAGRIHTHAGPLEVKQPGGAIGHGPKGRMGPGPLPPLPLLDRVELVVAVSNSRKDPHIIAIPRQPPPRPIALGLGPANGRFQALGRIARIFQTGPNGFQKHPFLGIHVPRFPGGDAKEGRVKFIRVLNEPTPATVALAIAPLRVKNLLPIEAIGGHFLNGAATGGQGLPKGFQGFALGIATRQPHDRQGLVTVGGQ